MSQDRMVYKFANGIVISVVNIYYEDKWPIEAYVIRGKAEVIDEANMHLETSLPSMDVCRYTPEEFGKALQEWCYTMTLVCAGFNNRQVEGN